MADLDQVALVTLPILLLEPALNHYQELKKRVRSNRSDALWQMAQVTWPLRVVRHQGRKVSYGIYFVHGHGQEELYWEIPRAAHDDEAVKLSILLRNLYRAGVAQGAASSSCYFLNFAAGTVHRVNQTTVEP